MLFVSIKVQIYFSHIIAEECEFLIKCFQSGGGLVNQLRKSYSLSDLSNQRHNEDETDSGDIVVTDPRLLMKRRRSPQRSSSTSSSHIYFSEMDIRKDTISHIQSVDDISSGYSSGEGLYAGQVPKISGREGIVRSGSIGGGKARITRVTRAGVATRRTVIAEVCNLIQQYISFLLFV